MKEIWKDVVGYEGFYKVSHWGRVRSLDREVAYWRGGTMIRRGILLKQSGRKYMMVLLSKYGKVEYMLVHRIVAAAFIPNPENKPEVNHKDGDKKFNHYKNLEWVTRQENQQHASNTGLLITGSRHKASKLTVSQVKEIRRKYIPYVYSLPMLAKEYGISVQSIWAIVNGKVWRREE